MIATPQPPAAPNVQAIFARSWSLLRRNPIVAGPLLISVVGVLLIFAAVGAAVFFAVLQHAKTHLAATDAVPNIPPGFIGLGVALWFVIVIVAVVFNLAIYVAMFGLADAVWLRGSATFADGWAAVHSRTGALFVAMIGYLLLAFASIVLALPTLGLSILALPLFLMYVFPAVVAGHRGGFAAIAESARFVRRNFGTSAIAGLLLLAILYGVSFLALPFILPLQISYMTTMSNLPTTPGVAPNLPIPPAWQLILAGVGEILAIAVSTIIYSFGAIVLTGLYHAVRERTELIAAMVPAANFIPASAPPAEA